MAQWKRVWLVSMRMQVRSLASLSRSGIWRCCDLWCRSQIQLGLDPALLWLQRRQAWFIGRHDSTPSLGTPTCHRCGPKKQKKQKTNKQKNTKNPSLLFWGIASEHSQLTTAPHGRAGRGCTIPQMPRGPLVTCVALECTRKITRRSGFPGMHIPPNSEAFLWRTFWSFSFLEFIQGPEKPRKFHFSYFCLPPPTS